MLKLVPFDDESEADSEVPFQAEVILTAALTFRRSTYGRPCWKRLVSGRKWAILPPPTVGTRVYVGVWVYTEATVHSFFSKTEGND